MFWECKMNFPNKLSLVLCIMMPAIPCDAKLNALSDGPFAERLYQRLKNEGFPSEIDPATNDTHARLRICEDISGSGFFKWHSMDPVDMGTIHPELLQRSVHPDIFNQIYIPTQNQSSSSYEYMNSFQLRELGLINYERDWDDDSEENSAYIYFKELVFVCVLKSRLTNDFVPYYVSKEYNINDGDPYRAIRFMISGRREQLPYRHVVLSEKSANVYVGQDFNVEIYYLLVRKYRQLAENPDDDPVCKLISRPLDSQHIRLCAVILSSPYFKVQIEAIDEVGGRLYHERMLNCYYKNEESDREETLMISRAYRSNQLFVYTIDSLDGSIYLQYLIKDVSFLIEPARYNFHDVES